MSLYGPHRQHWVPDRSRWFEGRGLGESTKKPSEQSTDGLTLRSVPTFRPFRQLSPGADGEPLLLKRLLSLKGLFSTVSRTSCPWGFLGLIANATSLLLVLRADGRWISVSDISMSNGHGCLANLVRPTVLAEGFSSSR